MIRESFFKYPPIIQEWDKTLEKCPCGGTIIISYNFEIADPALLVGCTNEHSIIRRLDFKNPKKLSTAEHLLAQFKDLHKFFVGKEKRRIKDKL